MPYEPGGGLVGGCWRHFESVARLRLGISLNGQNAVLIEERFPCEDIDGRGKCRDCVGFGESVALAEELLDFDGEPRHAVGHAKELHLGVGSHQVDFELP